MSQESVEVVRQIYRAWGRGDFSSAEWADPDIEFIFHSRKDGPEDVVLRGTEAMGQAWAEWLGAWEQFRVEGREVIDLGDDVVGLVEFGGRGKASGVSVERMSGGNLFSFRDGKVVRLTTFSDRTEALEAAGLSE
jgi:ketosteroid isomerase-like protein